MCPQIISFKCTLKNAAGRLISETYNREVLNAIAPGQGGTLSGLNKNMQNLTRGGERQGHRDSKECEAALDCGCRRTGSLRHNERATMRLKGKLAAGLTSR